MGNTSSSVIESEIDHSEKKCLICTDEKVTETLLKRGLEIVGDGAKKGRRLIKFSECGHVREADLSAALEGHVRCHECGETYLRNLQIFIY